MIKIKIPEFAACFIPVNLFPVSFLIILIQHYFWEFWLSSQPAILARFGQTLEDRPVRLTDQPAQPIIDEAGLSNSSHNPNITFVGFWNHSDRWKLESSEHRFEMCRDPLDLRKYAEPEDEDEDLTRASVDEIVEKCLGYEVEQRREISMSDWDDEYLSEDQVVYACVDAYCAFLIGRNIRAWKFT